MRKSFFFSARTQNYFVSANYFLQSRANNRPVRVLIHLGYQA
jgi:hypothetical protein